MIELQEKILSEGEVIGTEVLIVDSFLNHQIDPAFIMRMGGAVVQRFKGEHITKVLTVESSGIAVAMAVGLALNVPVLFAKKKKASTQQGDLYSADIYSFTRRESVNITVTGKYLTANDSILIVDDFLAHGEALKGLVSIVQQAGANLVGAAIVIEKCFQGGGESLRAEGLRIESLAAIEFMEPGKIKFV